jgi:hypothetical protein
VQEFCSAIKFSYCIESVAKRRLHSAAHKEKPAVSAVWIVHSTVKNILRNKKISVINKHMDKILFKNLIAKTATTTTTRLLGG